ncbi:MAG: ABC transporter permease subunit [Clostridia bacterium]|nr:ABC transporter permease subunit [Clostridia bacterium]
MPLILHELRKNCLAVLIWTTAITFMLGVTIVIFPEMAGQMGEMENMFAEMGAFTEAFGMDRINFGEFSGYFGIECGNVLGMGGAFFAAVAGIAALSSEESHNTAEFLLSHPISRARVVTLKLLSVISQIIILNVVVVGIVVLLTAVIIDNPPYKTMFLIFLSYFILQLQIAFICFGISAFIKSNAIGLGIGVGFMFYMTNILSNITKDLKLLKYLTPFSYTDSADIISNGHLTYKYLLVGATFAVIGIALAFIKYTKKDIA